VSEAQTIVDRRIGRNELSAIRTLLACVDAERDYFDRTKQANGTGVYAAWSAPRGSMMASIGPSARARAKVRWDRW
jgi:hypothetical protein